MRIFYKKGYKYQLAESYSQITNLYPGSLIHTEYIQLTLSGVLTIKEGYAWDGPSGPTIDTKNFMRGSLVHDALYQLIRLGYLPPHAKEDADNLLYSMCLEDGMSTIRASWVRLCVQVGGGSAILPEAEPEVLEAP